MDYNPLSARCIEFEEQIKLIEQQRSACKADHDWYSSFDPIAISASLEKVKQIANSLETEHAQLAEKRADDANDERELTEAAKLGLDPRWWISDKRIELAKKRDAARALLAKTERSIAENRDQTATAKDLIKKHLDAQSHYISLNPQVLKDTLHSLDSKLESLRSALAPLKNQKACIDRQLSAPLKEQREISLRIANLEGDLDLANQFENRLSRASNAYEKAMVHEECGKSFDGESRPGRVRQSKQRELQAERRNLEKIQARLAKISQLAQRTIRRLVIDGNNLCYEGREFIGLEGLLVLTWALVDKYEVIVVFDAGIRGLTRMNDQQITYGFPREVRVHIVASANAADQTILEAASAHDAYVLSNDRFRDFSDKDAVHKQRLIQHDILAGKVSVHDLNVTVEFEREFGRA